ncbi:hypothetical protein DSM3645_10337 [Blastopirellula marina DSM 3645]|uniref:DUF4325 domain-containing protein n=1 Tax=Blastopirellula marina DSM 3645 TaxID=314230 RepID=A3ZM08_9BACT|nr:hypothetical protein DSM3645_10337 [Blastopirellula marina DSM 3645]
MLDFAAIQGAYPNVVAPVAGLLEMYRSEEQLSFEILDSPDFLGRTCIFNPAIAGLDLGDSLTPMNVVWKFATPNEINQLVNAYITDVARAVECKIGVLQGLEWCLNEVMDNILQHSLATHGYAMGQIHPSSQHIALCIFDHGRGLYNSLKATVHQPSNAVEAIKLAVQEGVTRDKNIGQGNGMWGLQNIVMSNSGFLNITSGPGFVGRRNTELNTSLQVPFPSYSNNCTTVDFQIDFDKEVSIVDALGGYQPINQRIENLEDDFNNIIYRVSDQPSGSGTRKSGVLLRNELLNIKNESNSLIQIDFSGLSVIASSFADELVGKLILICSSQEFERRFKIVGANETILAIINRSVTQRIRDGMTDDSEATS